MMAYIESKINYCIGRYILSCSQHFFCKNKKPPPLWMNIKALKLIKKKHNAYKCWLSSHEGRNYEKYKRLRNKVKSITRKLTKAFEKNLAKKIKENPKAYWKYINSKRKCKININSLLSPDGIITEDDTEKVDILNTFFTSVFTKEDLNDIPDFNDNYNGHCIINIQFSEKDIEEILKTLKVTKSPGPDNIHPRIPKELANVLAKPLYLLFRKSIDTGKLPISWKDRAHISSVYKSGEKFLPKNYRPISLTSIVCKCLEKLVRDQ